MAETLAELNVQGLKLAVFSDTESDEARVRSRLRTLGIDQYFHAVVTSVDIGHVKPEPEAFAAVLSRLGVSPTESLFVGHDEDELTGAAHAGLTTVAFNHEPDVVADYYLDHFSELMEIARPESFAEVESEAWPTPAIPALAHHITKIGRLSTIYMLGTIAPQVIGMLLLPVFTRFLPKEQMDIVTLALSIGGLLTIVLQLGLWSGLKSQYFQTPEAMRPQLVRTVLLGQIVQAALICSALSFAGFWIADSLLPKLPLQPNLVLRSG